MSGFSHTDHVINLELIRQARSTLGGFQKRAFIPGGDMAGGGAPPGGDPAAMGGAPPGGAPPGGDPMAGGGAPPSAPPPDPMAGGGGGNPLDQILQKLNQMGAVGAPGGAGAGAGALKPKVDVNMVLVQILKILARIADALGVQIPASEMVPGTPDIQQLASASQSGQPMPGMDPNSPAGGAGGQAGGAIAPVGGMQGMQPSGQPGAEKMGWHNNGSAFDTGGLTETLNKARAVAMVRRVRAA